MSTLGHHPVPGLTNGHGVQARHLRRFLRRAILATIIPPLIAGFFATIVFHWIKGHRINGDIETGASHGQEVFYAWFVVSVFGISLTEYALAGAEASMLTRPSWACKDASLIMMHGDKSWNGPDGWLHAFIGFVFYSRFSKTWLVLALPTIIAYVALPLSGITMELRQGYSAGSESSLVFGANRSAFNETDYHILVDHAITAWKSSKVELPPGRGIVYRPSESAEGVISDLSNDMSTIFIAPQSDDLQSGTAWGISAQYNCKVVTSRDEFSILGMINDTYEADTSDALRYLPQNTSNNYFVVRNVTWYKNVQAMMEVGTSFTINDIYIVPEYTAQFVGYNDDGSERIRSHATLDQIETLEIALWQDIITVAEFRGAAQRIISADVGVSIPEAYGAYSGNVQFYDRPLTAVGVKCESASAVGTAYINSLDGTFRDFASESLTVREAVDGLDGTVEANWHSPVTLAYGAALTFLQKNYFPDIRKNDTTWYANLLASVQADISFPAQPLPFEVVAFDEALLRLLSAEDLRRSMLQAYASYLTQMMYRGTQGRVKDMPSNDTWKADNLVVAEVIRILAPGPVPPELVLALLVIWALICFTLGVNFAFQRRWAETLDSYSLFRFGADAADRDEFHNHYCALDHLNDPQLLSIAGLIGDADPRNAVGHITLVQNQIADSGKLYR